MRSLSLHKWISLLLVLSLLGSFCAISYAEESTDSIPIPELFPSVEVSSPSSEEFSVTESTSVISDTLPADESILVNDISTSAESEPVVDSSENTLITDDVSLDPEFSPDEPVSNTENSGSEQPVIDSVPSASPGQPVNSESEVSALEVSDDGSLAEDVSSDLSSEDDPLSIEDETVVTPDIDLEDLSDPLIMVSFVYPQDVAFTLFSSSYEIISPATDSDIAEYLSSSGALESFPVKSTSEAAPFSDEPFATAGEDAEVFRSVFLLVPGQYFYSASAQGYQTVEYVPLVFQEGESDTTITIQLDKETLPYGLKGMPEGYELSEQDLLKKQKMIEHDVISVLSVLIPGVDYVDGEVYFLADSAEIAEIIAEAYSADLISYSYGVAVIHLNTATVLEAVTAAADPEIPLPVVQPNYIASLSPVWEDGGRERSASFSAMNAGEVPTIQSWQSWYDNADNPDPFLSDPTSNTYQYMHDVVNTYEAWGVTKGSGITVAVIDGSVADHNDLSRVSHAYDFYPDVRDDHGTHVAGIIAADLDNGVGGAGIAPEASILSIGVFDSSGSTSGSDIARAVNIASEHAQIINMSLGGLLYDEELETAIRNAVNYRNATVVVAMGNNGDNSPQSRGGTNLKTYPAAYDIPGLIAVQSTTESGALSFFSNYGPWADVSAPGSKIYSTVNGGGYAFKGGTSQAAPVVSGVCALYMSAFGNPGPAEMERIIKSATTNGVIDASKLFISDKTPPVMIHLNPLVNNTVPYNTPIVIMANPTASNDACILYTLDGKNPSVKDGEIVNGIVYDNPIMITSENGFTPGKRVTVKAACVSGMGILGNVSSSSFTVGYAQPTGIMVSGYPVGQSLTAGKSITLTAVVEPAEALQTDVVWRIYERPGCPGTTIDSKKGILKTASSDSGYVTVMASSGDQTETVKIYVSPDVRPVKTISLDKSLVLNYSSSYADWIDLVAYAYDASGYPVSGASFSWSSSNPKIAFVSNDGRVTAVGKGTATIICKATDGSNVSARCAVTVKQLVENISVTGPQYISSGKTATFKASVLPSTANSKTVVWSVVSSESGVSESGVSVKNGKVTVSSGVPSGSYKVYAVASDKSGVCGSTSFEIQSPVTSITLRDSGYGKDGEVWKVFRGAQDNKYNKDGSLKEAVLYSVEADYWGGSEKTWVNTSLWLDAAVTGPSDYVNLDWSSSKPAVATVDESGLVRAVSAGTATITCKALDGSNKKASVTIKVINPASSVSVVSSSTATLNALYSNFRNTNENLKILGVGKSVANKVAFGDAFGKPSITKVKWDYSVAVYDAAGYNELASTILANNAVSISSSGSVSAKAKSKSPVTLYTSSDKSSYLSSTDMNVLSSSADIQVTVIANALDGTGLHGYVDYIVSPLQKGLAFSYDGVHYYRNSFTINNVPQETSFSIEIWADKTGYSRQFNFTVKSSNPNIIGGWITQDTNHNTYLNVRSGKQKGTAKLTVTATDGSNKSCVLTVKVS